MNKGLNPHVKPGRQRPLSTLPMHSIPPTSLVQPVDKGQPTHLIPKPRIGQGKSWTEEKIENTSAYPITQTDACSTNNNTYSKGSTIIT